VVEPTSGASLSLDYWHIKKTGNITSPTIDTALDQGKWSRDPVTGRYLVFTNLQNFAESENSGIDLDGQFKKRIAGLGTLRMSDTATYYLHQRTRAEGEEWAEYNGTYDTVRWRNVFNIGLDRDNWSTTVAIRTTAGFADTDNASKAGTARRVPSHTETDWTGSYEPLKGLSLNGGIKNLFNVAPPFSFTNATNNLYSQEGFAELYSARGRFYYVGATYKFF